MATWNDDDTERPPTARDWLRAIVGAAVGVALFWLAAVAWGLLALGG